MPDVPVHPCFLLDLRHHSVRRILSDDVIPDSELKRRMKNTVDGIQSSQCEISFIQQIKILLQYVRVLDIDQLMLPEVLPDEAVIHVDISASGVIPQVVFR